MGCPPLSIGSTHWTHIEKGLLVGTRLVTALGARRERGGRERGREGGKECRRMRGGGQTLLKTHTVKLVHIDL